MVLLDLVEDVGERLRGANKFAGTARIKLRWKSFETWTRQAPLRPPACDNFSLRRTAEHLFAMIELREPVRLIGFGVTSLQEARAAGQLLLFDPAPDRTRHERLSRVIDVIRRDHRDLRRASALEEKPSIQSGWVPRERIGPPTPDARPGTRRNRNRPRGS